MRLFPTTVAVGILLSLAAIGLTGWAISPTADADDVAGHKDSATAAQFTPPAIYTALQKTVRLDVRGKTLSGVLKELSDKLGAKIELDRTGLPSDEKLGQFNFTLEEPISIKTALHVVLNNRGLHDRQITLEEDRVRIVGPAASDKVPVLRSLDLRGVSNYSTAMRRRFIDQVQHEVAPDRWGGEDGGWIVPARSVFAVDIYHKSDVHNEVSQLWHKQYVSGDVVLPIGFGPRHFQHGEKPTAEEINKRAKKLQAKYAFKSLGDRLKYEKERRTVAAPALSPSAAARLSEREKQAAEARKHSWINLRVASLERLHSLEVNKFVTREGFGLSRMPTPSPSFLPLPAPPQLALPSAEVERPAASAPASVASGAQGAVTASAVLPAEDRLTNFHFASESIFLSPERMGYARDRDHVAGFGSHAFMRMPRLEDHAHWYGEPTEQWAIRRLELVSLLKHEEPRVYVSAELPNMEKLGEVPTRKLGDFEHRALKDLLGGEDVVTRATTNRIDMLGALRATKQCLECHDVSRGQVLGAFSYTLYRDPAVSEAIEAH